MIICNILYVINILSCIVNRYVITLLIWYSWFLFYDFPVSGIQLALVLSYCFRAIDSRWLRLIRIYVVHFKHRYLRQISNILFSDNLFSDSLLLRSLIF